QRDGAARAVGEVPAAAVVDAAVVEAHVPLRDDHRDLVHFAVVELGVLLQQALQVGRVPVGEVAGGAVVAADLLPQVTTVHHGDGAHLLVGVVERDERGQHPFGGAGLPVVPV